MLHWPDIYAALRNRGIDVPDNALPIPVSGGGISSTWQLQVKDCRLFLKTGSAADFDMFSGEAEGLLELEKGAAIRVPAVLACCRAGEHSVLALEWLDLRACSATMERNLGAQLAQQHRVTVPRFGWHRDNHIGSTPQQNASHSDWTRFFLDQRLGFQFELAARNGFGGELAATGKHFLDDAEACFDGHDPAPSLLHGDLWGGNWGVCDAVPVVFDPAVYFGDRETDLAMTRLFGGFGRDFYAAYENAWPLAAGAEHRMQLYSLYHILNHLNLFGSAYLSRAKNLLKRLR